MNIKPLFELPELLTLDGRSVADDNALSSSANCGNGCNAGCTQGTGTGFGLPGSARCN
jgi:hypothetical protein